MIGTASEFTICDEPTEADRLAILHALAAFNAENGYPGNPQPVALLVKDDAGQVIGGLWGRTVYDGLFVDYLILPEALRGRDLVRSSCLLRRASRWNGDVLAPG